MAGTVISHIWTHGVTHYKLMISDDLDNDIDDIIQDFEAKCEREVLHTVLFY